MLSWHITVHLGWCCLTTHRVPTHHVPHCDACAVKHVLTLAPQALPPSSMPNSGTSHVSPHHLGAETGLYHLPGPDQMLNLLVSSMAGVSPCAYPLIESALMPLCAVVSAAVSAYFDYWGRKYARRHWSEQQLSASKKAE